VSPRRIGYAIGLVVLVASGAYLLVYLYRWEWNRAMIAGLFFVSAEVGLATATIMSRLSRIETKLDEEHAEVAAKVREAAPEPRRHFEWLREDATRMQVFVPVLLGAGVLLSGLAWVVDKIAQTTARPVLESRLVASLAPISFPAGGLLGPAPQEVLAHRHHRLFGWRQLAVVGLTALVLFAGIDWLGDATQNRPDVNLPNMHTTVQVEIDTRRTTRAPEAVLEGLWVVCRSTVSERVAGMNFVSLGGNRAAMVVQPALGEHAVRRFRGCIDDATIDRVVARVVSIEALPNS